VTRTAVDDVLLIIGRDPGLTSHRGTALRILQELFDWKPAWP
jgi:ATP-dependent DNA helicase RecG